MPHLPENNIHVEKFLQELSELMDKYNAEIEVYENEDKTLCLHAITSQKDRFGNYISVTTAVLPSYICPEDIKVAIHERRSKRINKSIKRDIQ